ncbi:proteinase B [Savitreella phatthalungensis]
MKFQASLIAVVLFKAAAASTKHAAVDEAPLVTAYDAETIDHHYIVVFKDHVRNADAAEHHQWVQSLHASSLEKRDLSVADFHVNWDVITGLKHVYSDLVGFAGYSGAFTDEVVAELRKSPDVDFIERDSVVHALAPVKRNDSQESELEKNAPWGLARLSHKKTLGFSTFNKYEYDASAGEGVTAYIIDTGINVDHVDFEGRARWGKTIPQGDADIDGNGHGTHCAGTVAGKRYGVAKKANVVAVKVLRSNGSGSMSDVVAGVQWAADAHKAAKKDAANKKKPFKGSTANMSLGGGKSPALDRVVNAAVDSGIHFAVAAGNDNADACNYSPAAAEKAVTVGASSLADERAYFSNHGKCTDIFAPGLNILSTWIGSKYATNTISGTSMASPHICGLLTYALGLQPTSSSAFGGDSPVTPLKLKKKLISLGSVGVLADLPAGTPNILANNGIDSESNPWIVEKTERIDELRDFADAISSGIRSEIQELRELVDMTIHEGL